MAILIKSAAEIEKMRISGIALRKVHDAVRSVVRVGATTMDLERAAVAKIEELGAKSAFKGYHGYPAALCTSVNNEVIHGIPNDSACCARAMLSRSIAAWSSTATTRTAPSPIRWARSRRARKSCCE